MDHGSASLPAVDAGPNSVAPAAPAACQFCQRPLGDPYYRAAGRTCCADCAGQIYQFVQRNRFAAGPWLRGALAGLVTAIVCGFVWAAITKASHYEYGILAVGVGIVVTKVIMVASGNRRGPSIQVLAIVLSLLAIFAGKEMTVAWVVWDQLVGPLAPGVNSWAVWTRFFLVAPWLGFNFMDLLWYGIAIYEGYRLARMPRLQIEGPFSIQPPTAGQPLQFDTVQTLLQPVSQPLSPPLTGPHAPEAPR
jgi:hypothetical protein